MQRKPLRLPEYDYGQAGLYFLTICAKDRAALFGRVCVGGGVLDAPWVELSEYGAVVQERLNEMNRTYSHICVQKYVIMPNHIHVLVEVHGEGPSGTPVPTRANQAVPAFVSTLKRMTNRSCGCQLWQRGCHDHIIRGEADLLRVWTYIDTNPARWAQDEYFTRE